MMQMIRNGLVFVLWFFVSLAYADAEPKVVDIPTRPGVTQRLLVLAPLSPKAGVILFAGSHGGLQIALDGSFGWGMGNFLIRSRQLFVDQGLLSVVIDAPSDRQSPPYLVGFRHGAEHAADVQAVIAWVRQQSGLPVWLVGTSRGTQSIAAVATRLSRSDGPDGLVLTSTILTDPKAPPVTAMALERLSIPVLVAHHELDGCSHCAYSSAMVSAVAIRARRWRITASMASSPKWSGRLQLGYWPADSGFRFWPKFPVDRGSSGKRGYLPLLRVKQLR